MTKYILYGGGCDLKPAKLSFLRELTLGFSHTVHLLLVYFARPESEFVESTAIDQADIFNQSETDKIEFMTANIQDFAAQTDWADVVYFAGGDTQRLYQSLFNIPKLSTLIKDKVIAGSSAGVHVLAAQYYSKSSRAVDDGFGLLPLKILCHYDSKTDASIITTLSNQKKQLPLLALAEYQWVTFYQ
jgi:cyanophycinase-like exopeptidase